MVGLADVRAGKCLVSAGPKPRVLRILSVTRDVVRFEALKRKHVRASTGEAACEEFLQGVLREVGCDYDPAAHERVQV
jgi:hypothetical protein